MALLFLASGPLLADQDDPRLEPLFASLAEAGSPQEAQDVEYRIWSLWIEHEDEKVKRRMSVAGAAMGEGLLDAALQEVNQVVALAPGYAEGWNRRATILFMLGRFEDSLADTDRVLALEPRHFGALSGRGLNLMSLGRLADAESAFIAALAIHPQMMGARANLMLIERELGDPI